MKPGELKVLLPRFPDGNVARAGWTSAPNEYSAVEKTINLPVGSLVVVIECAEDRFVDTTNTWVRCLTAMGPLWFLDKALGDT